MGAWIRRLRIRRVERAIRRELSLALKHQIRAEAWRMVLREIREERR